MLDPNWISPPFPPFQLAHCMRTLISASMASLRTHPYPFLPLLLSDASHISPFPSSVSSPSPEAKEERKERGEGERDACLHDSPPQENERSASSSFPPFSPSPHNPARFWQEEAEEEGKKSVLKSPRRGGGGPHVGSFEAHAAGREGESAGFSYMGKGRRGFEVYGPPPSSPFPPGRKEKKSFGSVLPHLCPVLNPAWRGGRPLITYAPFMEQFWGSFAGKGGRAGIFMFPKEGVK